MRPRKIKVSIQLSGFTMPVGEIKVKKFADYRGIANDGWRKKHTARICPDPECAKEPSWVGGYKCECGKTYNHWSRLKQIMKATGEAIIKNRLTAKGEDVVAQAYVMQLSEFQEKCVDATAEELGVTTSDSTSALNLRKLLIATKLLNVVILLRFNDTYEQRICVLTTNISGRVILKDIIPLNLVDIKETMKVNLEDITPEQLEEAKKFVAMLPHATEDLLTVDDYRAIGLDAEEIVSEKVMQLEEVLKKLEKANLDKLKEEKVIA